MWDFVNIMKCILGENDLEEVSEIWRLVVFLNHDMVMKNMM